MKLFALAFILINSLSAFAGTDDPAYGFKQIQLVEGTSIEKEFGCGGIGKLWGKIDENEVLIRFTLRQDWCRRPQGKVNFGFSLERELDGEYLGKTVIFAQGVIKNVSAAGDEYYEMHFSKDSLKHLDVLNELPYVTVRIDGLAGMADFKSFRADGSVMPWR